MIIDGFSSPAYHIIAVPFEKIVPNTYNPNSVAPPEMKLLYLSILEDGYTQPIVCYYSKKQDLYAIVDGFHRWRIMKEHRDIYEREHGMLPVAVIDKPLSNRMASTIRHNRARGSHNVDLMSNIIKELHELGRSDAWIARHLGMDRDEILRLCSETYTSVRRGDLWTRMRSHCLQRTDQLYPPCQRTTKSSQCETFFLHTERTNVMVLFLRTGIQVVLCAFCFWV